MKFILMILVSLEAFAQGTSNSTVTTSQPHFQPSLYAGIIGGVGDYSGTEEVRGATAYGVMLGRKLSPQWNFEMSFVQSRYEVLQSRCSSSNCAAYNDPVEMTLNQQNLSLIFKRLFTTSTVRPFVAVGGSYVIRDYDNRRSYYLSGREIASPESSRNFQLYIGGGAEVEFGKDFFLSSSVSVLYPLTQQAARTADQLSGKLYDVDRPVEELTNYMLSLTGVFVF